MNPLEQLAYDPARARDTWVHNHIAGAGVTQKRTWDAAIDWYKDSLLEWESLTDAHALLELRKGERSIFFPLFEADPIIRVDCVGCGRTHPFDIEGICHETGWEIDTPTMPRDWD